ncbi:endonuclease/exonuclease/phosphatase family protein [Bergeyella sp. RCAD1439]|uniref:endonuclease/exonuclease/phosphatase family protein n=1 Tax=Bergeyella anatis TaxID=3113737 RepID=UPI002E16D789|nr:endonuclease/exonuclease/phosphatase family protein [Bergeyella sp. RCAD1439]
MALFRIVLFGVHLLVAFLLLATLLNAYVPPRVFGYLNLLSLAFPILFAGYVGLCLFWIFSWRKRAFFFIALGVFFMRPVQRWVNYSEDSGRQGNLKIITFNTKNGAYSSDEAERQTLAFLEKEAADIVLLQENTFDQVGANDLQYPVVGLRTKHRILHHEKLTDDQTNGHAFYADIDLGRTVVRVVNVYLEPYYMTKAMIKPEGDAQTNKTKAEALVGRLVPTYKIHQDQVLRIRRAIEESPYPVILGGDFNSVPNSWEYYHLGKGLKDAFQAVGNGSGTSFHDYKIPLRIDYLFASEAICPVSYKVDRTVTSSDHYPVIATFTLEK